MQLHCVCEALNISAVKRVFPLWEPSTTFQLPLQHRRIPSIIHTCHDTHTEGEGKCMFMVCTLS
jgi:hypothetical protein